jgi:hypothetical protein
MLQPVWKALPRIQAAEAKGKERRIGNDLRALCKMICKDGILQKRLPTISCIPHKRKVRVSFSVTDNEKN